MRRVATFVLTAALYLQSVVPAFASSGGADTPACRPSKQMNSPSPQGTVGYTYDNAARVYQIPETNGPITTHAYDDASLAAAGTAIRAAGKVYEAYITQEAINNKLRIRKWLNGEFGNPPDDERRTRVLLRIAMAEAAEKTRAGAAAVIAGWEINDLLSDKVKAELFPGR